MKNRTIVTGNRIGGGGHSPKIYAGSRRRLKRIKFRGNWSIDIWLFVIWALLILFVFVPWMIRHPPDDSHAPFSKIPAVSAPR